MLFWLVPSWLLSLFGAFYLGYFLRGLVKKIVALEEVVKSKIDKKPEEPEPISELIDPSDPVQNAIYERKLMMEKLNGKDNQNN